MKYNAAEARKLDVAIEDPLVVADPDAFAWDETADLVVVGLGGAGVAAALEGLERVSLRQANSCAASPKAVPKPSRRA